MEENENAPSTKSLVLAYSQIFSLTMYFGEWLKLLLKIPRPSNLKNSNLVQDYKPRHYNEYGPPSTHVMGIVMCGFPFFGSLFGSSSLLFFASLCIFIGLARIYLGAHSVLCVFIATVYNLLIIKFYPVIVQNLFLQF